MKILTTVFTLAALSTSIASNAQTIEFQIQGLKSSDGKVLVQLFNSEQGYENNNAHSANIVNAKQGIVTITFHDIEPGEYAIQYFHDENNNGQLETNLFGMPTEGYGYSNNAKANFGPATFEQMKFSVQQTAVVNTSSVNY